MIVERAYLEMYPDEKLGKYDFSLNYSGKFNHYNANVRRRENQLVFNLSKEWRKINDDVKIGIIQSLMNRIFGTKVHTQNIELYEIFLKKVHIAVKKVHNDPVLERSFDRINERYFSGLIEKPNLKWGKSSTTKLGSYEYGSDTIVMSSIFKGEEQELLDFVMYHEMLHKKHKFYSKKGKSYHHTKEFKQEERRFNDFEGVEARLHSFVKKNKVNGVWKLFN